MPVSHILICFQYHRRVNKACRCVFSTFEYELTAFTFVLSSIVAFLFCVLFVPGGICDWSAVCSVWGVWPQLARLHASNTDGLHGSAPKVHGEFLQPYPTLLLTVICCPLCSGLLHKIHFHLSVILHSGKLDCLSRVSSCKDSTA